MTLRIAILGISGRLGQAIAREVVDDGRFSLSGGIVRADSDHAGIDLGEIIGRAHLGLDACVGIEDGTQDCDVLVDASTPDACIAAAERLSKRGGLSLVTGVTGLNSGQQARLKAASGHLPILAARNFSLGVALLESLTRRAAAALPASVWDAEIEEAHHRHKTDAPSGTALILGEAVAAARQQALADVQQTGRAGRRRPGDIGFAVTRGGGIVGEHAVRFLSELEEIALVHKAHDRRVFARGALEAALWLHGRMPGLYGMSDLLG